MDYRYIYLQNQIKALMNKHYVPSSSHSKIAEEIQNGNCNLLVDTIQKYFAFKYSGVSNPIYIDPLQKRLLNVSYINDVDVNNLLGGIKGGYGIIIEDLGKGIKKISVEENKFALKEDLQDVDGKFDHLHI